MKYWCKIRKIIDKRSAKSLRKVKSWKFNYRTTLLKEVQKIPSCLIKGLLKTTTLHKISILHRQMIYFNVNVIKELTETFIHKRSFNVRPSQKRLPVSAITYVCMYIVYVIVKTFFCHIEKLYWTDFDIF